MLPTHFVTVRHTQGLPGLYFELYFLQIFPTVISVFYSTIYKKYTNKVTIVRRILIISSICVLKFKLPSMQTKFYRSYSHQMKDEQASSKV